MALGDCCGCGFVVTLGGCRQARSSGGGLARVGDCSWPSLGDCEGSCTFPNAALNGNSSGLLMSLSYLTCG